MSAKTGNSSPADVATPKGPVAGTTQATSVTPIQRRLMRQRPGGCKLWRHCGQAHGPENLRHDCFFLHQGDETQLAVAARADHINAEGSAKQVVPRDVLWLAGICKSALATAPGDGEVTVIVGDETLGEADPLLAQLLAAATAGLLPAGPAQRRAPVRLVLSQAPNPHTRDAYAPSTGALTCTLPHACMATTNKAASPLPLHPAAATGQRPFAHPARPQSAT